MVRARPLVSVMMPAYGRPGYTRRALRSVVEQEYRPIEVVLSDNCSPTSLEPIVNEFRVFTDDLFSIRFYRQASNLGVCDNYTFLIDRLLGEYAISLNNDDWFTDQRFLTEAVSLMEMNPECNLCAANSEIENTNGQRMIKLPSDIDAKDKWSILPGDRYINLLGGDRIGHQSYSAVVFRLAPARSLGVMRYPFSIPASLAKEVGIPGDEGFALQFLLSSIGSVALTEKVVSIRGMPEESYSRSEKRAEVWNQAMFIVYYNLYRASLDGQYANAVKKRARETILFVYTVDSINWRILRHYNYRVEVLIFMMFSVLQYYTRYYARSLGRLKRAAVDKDSAERERIISKVRERGLFRSLFPFLR